MPWPLERTFMRCSSCRRNIDFEEEVVQSPWPDNESSHRGRLHLAVESCSVPVACSRVLSSRTAAPRCGERLIGSNSGTHENFTFSGFHVFSENSIWTSPKLIWPAKFILPEKTWKREISRFHVFTFSRFSRFSGKTWNFGKTWKREISRFHVFTFFLENRSGAHQS